jgi:hypothetical protein
MSMSEPETKPLETGGMVYAPVGIGGWLILPIIHLVLNAGLILFYLAKGFAKGFANGLAEGAPQAATAPAPPVEFSPGVDFAMALSLFSLLIVAYAVFCLIQFFRKKKSVPRLMIVFYILLLVLVGASYYLVTQFPELPHSPKMVGEATMGIVRTVIAVAIWIPYFLVSVRVKNTFVR